MSARNPCSIVLVIDRSGSMKTYNYMEPAKTDATTFMYIMTPGYDSLGIVAFNNSADIIFDNGALRLLKTKADQDRARDEIKKLKGSGMTNMASAFKKAAGMIVGATGNIAEVFLSDGLWNKGDNPLDVIGKTPIYTIALGPSAGEETLRLIAGETGGKYHYAPGPRELRGIYNHIAGETRVATLIGSTDDNVESYVPETIYATVPAGATQATFAFDWDNEAVSFTSGTPGYNQVNISLYDPHAVKINPLSTATGDGFAVLKIANPVEGEYSADIWYSGKGFFSYTAAVFDDNGRITAEITGPQETVAAGSPATIDFRLADEREPIDGARVKVSLDSPLVTLAEAAAAHAERLRALPLPEEGIPEEHEAAAKIAALQSQTGENLLPRQRRPIVAQAMGGGLYRIQIPGLEKAGSHTVLIVAHGYSAKSKTQFQRSSRLSFVVSGK